MLSKKKCHDDIMTMLWWIVLADWWWNGRGAFR